MGEGLQTARDLQWPALARCDHGALGALMSFLVRRLLLAVPTLFGVLVVAFLLLYVAPGDPVTAMIGERADSATIARLRQELRLDDPLHVRFGHYVGQIVRGDLGRSYITNRPITR